MKSSAVSAAPLVAAVLAASLTPARAFATDSLTFTAAQVAQGRLAYGKSCALCHGANLEGAAGVALAGATFSRSWGDGHHNARDLYVVTAVQMPKGAPGSLSESESLSILAYILSRNGYAASERALSVASLDTGLAPSGSGASKAEHGPLPRQFPELPAKVEKASGQWPDDADLLRIRDADWLTYNRDLGGDRYSPLAQINVRNAGRLRVQCLLQLGELGSFETSPVVYQGRMYLTTAHKVFAVDAANCATLWAYNYVPVDPEHLPGNRGVALYRGKVFRGTTDGHLLALDAQSGKLLWDVRVADGGQGYEITGAPVAFDGKVFTGDAGADVGINGRVYAFDADNGALKWSFDIIPTGVQPGVETWGGGTTHGGGATWSSMAIDAAQRLLFVPTGNPAPDFNDQSRPGANLYTDAVVALSLDTGKLAWYAQQVPHDVHDWDTAAAPALFEQQGRKYMAVASKNGLLFIYDRDTHETLARAPFTTRENVDAPLRMNERVHVCPGALGQYNGAAYSPPLKRLFVAAADRCNVIQKGEAKFVPGGVYFGGLFIPDPKDRQSGWIKAFDPTNGAELWSVHRQDIVLSGVTPTAGGLLLTGDGGGDFLALDARDGRILFRFATGGPIAAGVSTYLAAGKQFIAVPSGSSSRDSATASGAATLVVFGLP